MAYIKHEWQNGEVITADKLNSVEKGIDCLANCNTIWKNTNPKASFSAQEIKVDTTRFSEFEFYFLQEIDDQFQNIRVKINKNRAYIENGACRTYVKYDNFERCVTITDDKIIFSDCLYVIKYNGKLIPYSIHAFE